MARKGYGRNSTLVNISTHPDDGTSPVGSNEWNENPKKDGIFGLTKSTQAISSNDIDVTDSYIEVSNAGDIYTLSAVTTSLPSANYASDSASSISEGDLIYVVKAAGVGTVNLKHQNGGAGAGKITTLTAGDKALSTTVPTILMARTIGSALEWVEYGGGAVADGSITSAKIANDSIINEDINSSANIALSKLASDPLARANHTGTQAASTISDFDTEVANNTAVAANTAKTGISTAQADLLSATAGTTSASKALVVDSNKDLTGINDLTVAGDLTVSGTTTTVNVEDLTVDTADITIMNGNTTASAADDSGIKTQIGTSSFKTLLWKHATSAWTSSDNIDSTEYKIAGTTVLSGSTLGSTITGSSLTSVGTLASGVLTGCTGLPLGTGITGTLPVANGGTNLASYTAGDILYATGATTLAKLAKGTTEQTLKMNSGATAPEWVTVAGAGATTLHKYTASNQTTVFTVSANSIAYDVGTTVATQAAGAGQREIYIRKIDTNNEGVFTIIHKNGALVEVQIA